jgi:hypothetical protein
MKMSSISLGTISLIAALAAVGFWRELDAERQRSSDLSAELGDATRRIEFLESQRSLTSSSSVHMAAPPVAVPVAATKNEASLFTGQQAPADPSLRQGFQAQMRLAMPQRFPDLMTELGLTPDQLGRLFDLLVKQQEESRSTSAALRGSGEADRIRSYAELKQKQQAELSALLGTKFPRFEEYKETQPARQQTAELRSALESGGTPLREDQVQLLNKTMIAERQRLKQEEQDLLQSRMRGSQNTEQYTKTLLDLRAESDRRALSAAGTFLTEPQMQSLRLQIESRAPVSRREAQLAPPTAESR